MADNVSINPGTTTPIATDDVSGIQFQKMKVNLGADGVDGALWDGKVAVTAGTINTGTIDILKAGTISKIEGGTIGLITTVTNISNGTIQSSGTTTGVGTITNIGTLDVLKNGTVVVSTLPNITQGSINVTAGTGIITSGSISVIAGTVESVGTVPGIGTITNIGSISTIGTMPAISVGNSTGGTLDLLKLGTVVVSSITSGSINVGTMVAGTLNAGTIDLIKAGTISMINAGTITSVGTVPGVGVVTNLTSGSVRMTVGTLTVMPNVPGGSIAVTAGTINAGTIQMVNAGTISMINAGTITSSGTTTGVGTLSSLGQVHNAGTVQNILGGTVKLDGRTGRDILSQVVVGTAGAASYGTIVGSASVGAGTSTWVNRVSIVVTSGTVDCAVGLGTALTGSSVLERGSFAPNGGISASYDYPVNCGMTNQDLVWYLGGAGTATFSVKYFISA